MRGKKLKARGLGGTATGSSTAKRGGRTNVIGVSLACLAMVFATFQFITLELASRKMLSGEITAAPWRVRADAQALLREEVAEDLVPVQEEDAAEKREPVRNETVSEKRVPPAVADVPTVGPHVSAAGADVPAVGTHVPQVEPHISVPPAVKHVPTVEPQIPQDEPQIPQEEPQIPQNEPQLPQDEPHMPPAGKHVPTVGTHVPTVGTHVSTAEKHVLSKEELFRTRASEQGIILMTAAIWSQKVMLSNFLCNLARLELRNYVVAALDQQTFDWTAKRGHGVFLFTDPKTNAPKLKSAVVLEALGLGYSVFFLDPDVVLFKNPVQHIPDFSQMWVLLDASLIEEEMTELKEKEVEPQNGKRRINSGCYFVPATKAAVSAFMVLEYHSRDSNGPPVEPSLFNALCLPPWGGGDAGSCVFVSTAGTLQVQNLDRSAFAQGSVFPFEGDPAYEGVLFHNWVKGDKKKIENQQAVDLWYVRPDGTCCDGTCF